MAIPKDIHAGWGGDGEGEEGEEGEGDEPQRDEKGVLFCCTNLG